MDISIVDTTSVLHLGVSFCIFFVRTVGELYRASIVWYVLYIVMRQPWIGRVYDLYQISRRLLLLS